VKKSTHSFAHRFLNFIRNEQLFDDGDSVLLAISGGIDSVAMAVLFKTCGFRFGIAHCNFQLRNEESDLDEQFISDIARQMGVPFFSVRFNTTDYAEAGRISIQMAARELRYAWFETIRKANGYAMIATAHHRDDQTETVILNLIRGTGLAGLHGIKSKSGHVIRPLLFAGKDEIIRYVTDQNVTFRTDQSNNESNYKRNKIRLEIVPAMVRENPSFHEGISKTARLIRESELLINEQTEQWIAGHRSLIKNVLRFDTREILSFPSPNLLLWKICEPFGYNESQVESLFEGLTKSEEQQFTSEQFTLTKSRHQITIRIKQTKEPQAIYHIRDFHDKVVITEPLNLVFRKLPANTLGNISRDPKIALFDASTVIFPLTIRKWVPGDFFFPFGQKARKKLSDFFNDLKLTREQKEDCWLLCSHDMVLWVIGYRIDHRLRITSSTADILEIILTKFAEP
jgi:tRNA(Ile)-lysidine synthase